MPAQGLERALREEEEAGDRTRGELPPGLFSAGGSVSMSGVVPGALGGAGVTALLFLCLGLLYLCM